MSKFRRAKIMGRQTKRFMKKNWELIACAGICTATLVGGVSVTADAEINATPIDEDYVIITTSISSSESTSTTETVKTTKVTTTTTTTTDGTTTTSNTTTSGTSTTTTVAATGYTMTDVIQTEDGEMIGYPYDSINDNGDIVVYVDDVNVVEVTSTTETVLATTTVTTTTVVVTSTEPVETTTIETTTVETTTEAPIVNNQISDADYILLCNCVAHEAGANNISAYNKALVVEVIMNRVADSRYPDTIRGVITQRYQFSGSSTYANLGTYSSKVTDLVKEAVDLYFADPSQFNHGYLSFSGDGKQNYFR